MSRNFAFSKINAGKVNKRGKFNLSHSLLGSMSFGDVLPTFCKLMMPDSSLKGSIDTKIRVQPMPLPPFGKCAFHQYGQFVSITDLYRPFPELMAGKIYTGSVKRYVPTQVPSLPMRGPVSILSQLLTDKFCFWSCHYYVSSTVNVDSNDGSFTYRLSDGVLDNNAKFGSVQLNNSGLNRIFGFSGLNIDNADAYYQKNGFGYLNRVNSGTIYSDAKDGTDVYRLLQRGVSMRPETADLILFADKEMIGSSTSVTDKDGIAIVVRWTAEGRRLVRALNALGIQVSPQDTSLINMLPVFAYYKAWFDVFAPKRNIHWTDTKVYELLDYLAETNMFMSNFGNATADKTSSGVTNITLLNDVFYNLSDMWATCDPNYFTTAIRNINPTAQSDTEIDSDVTDLDSSSQTGASVRGVSPQGKPAYAFSSDSGSNNYITRIQLQLVNTLSKYVNTNTVLGQNLDAFFKAHFSGYTGRQEASKFAGASVTDIQLGDTIVTASTDDAKAGDFAGVGFGSGGYKINYRSKEFGYFIVFGCVKPVSNYVQGTEYDSYITSRYQFPHTEFDALGFESVKKGEILQNSALPPAGNLTYFANQPFGYQPRYTGHKVMKSLVVGEPSFLSSRDQWLGFGLDNIISSGFSFVLSDGTVSTVGFEKCPFISYVQVPSDTVTAQTGWRWLGKYPWLGNQKRIFYDSNPVSTARESAGVFYNSTLNRFSGKAPQSDGFILYNDYDVTYNAPLLSIGSSYDTIDGADNYVNHE